MLSGAYLFFNNKPAPELFKTNLVLFRSIVKENEIFENQLKITNIDKESKYTIKLNNFDDFIKISENNFSLNPNENKTINITFNSNGKDPGIYVGSLIINNNESEKEIPLILEVQSDETYYAIQIETNPENKLIKQEGVSKTRINLFNVRDTRTHDLSIKYLIINTYGDTILKDDEIINVGTKTSFEKTFIIPKDTPIGNYIFSILVNEENSVSTSSYQFEVTSKRTSEERNFILIASIFIIFILIGILLTIYMIYERNKLFGILKYRQKNDLINYRRKIENEEKNVLLKSKSKKERDKKIKELVTAKKRLLFEMKKEQKIQREKFAELDKKKSKELLKNQLEKWRREGYNKAIKSAKLSKNLSFKLVKLEEAYKEGYISKDSYEKGSERIKKAHNKLKRKSL